MNIEEQEIDPFPFRMKVACYIALSLLLFKFGLAVDATLTKWFLREFTDFMNDSLLMRWGFLFPAAIVFGTILVWQILGYLQSLHSSIEDLTEKYEKAKTEIQEVQINAQRAVNELHSHKKSISAIEVDIKEIVTVVQKHHDVIKANPSLQTATAMKSALEEIKGEF